MANIDDSLGMSTQDSSGEFIIARQPVFGNNMAIFGYELFFRPCGDEKDIRINDYDLDQATLLMIADGFSLATAGIEPKKKVFFNVTRESLLGDYVMALPASNVILEIPADTQFDTVLLEKCLVLKKNGFQFTVDNFKLQPDSDKILAIADFVKISIADFDNDQIIGIGQMLKKFPCIKVATRIETWEMFSAAKLLGFDYFQGFFFSQAEVVPGRKAPTIGATRLKLMKELAVDDIDLKVLEATISTDPSLSVRLLKFVNTSAFRMLDKVDSIGRAIAILGAVPLKRWAMTVLLADSDSSDKGQEIVMLLLHRAIFLRNLAASGFIKLANQESLFLLGLLSSADSLFGMKMEELIAGIPLVEYIKDALLLKPDSALVDFVYLLKHIEQNKWEEGAKILDKHGIPPLNAAKIYMKASQAACDALSKMAC